ncbi:GNAT family N-acetyltransferase [Pseudoalteromonas sp. T1lg75]|uniref:GNAT family N-acetyltransferase n=1 Tax=Pseudoalteromonas sp. T1lg75 TaxID=2077102 RepID=UPI001319C6B3|nr:GNAT family N-acetyltransferase [Pseudoalteromonas sp. T1lg75]
MTLRPICHKDAPDLYALLTHPEVVRYNDYAMPSKQQVRDIIQGDIELFLTGEGVRMAIMHQGQLIGSCGIYDAHTQVAKLGYELHPSFWGKGLMYHALSLLLSHGEQYMGGRVTAVEALVHRDNLRSIRLLQRLGFSFVTESRYQLIWHGAELRTTKG